MLKYLLILVAGLCAGYWFGWDDHELYNDPIYVRAVHAVGGTHRNQVKTDPDAQMDSLEKTKTP